MVDLDQLVQQATQRMAEFINRSHAQQLRRMRESWSGSK